MSVQLQFSGRTFSCDCYGEGSTIFHKVGEGFKCSGCGCYHQGSFTVIEEPQSVRIQKLEEALEKISSLAYRQEYDEIVEIVNEVLGR